MDFCVLKTILCGLVIGSSMLIPGLSGGTTAIILGIYDRLISSVAELSKGKNRAFNLKFLITFMVGAGIGIYLFSGIVLKAMTHFRKPLMFLVIGIILSAIPPLAKKAGVLKIKLRDILSVLCGLSVCIFFTVFRNGLFCLDGSPSVKSFIITVIAGLLIAIALILPGISCSQCLMILGIFEMTLDAVKSHNLLLLIPLALSVIIGILIFSNVLNTFLTKHTRTAYLIITGFVMGSVIDAFPGVPKGLEILICPLTFAAGLSIIKLVSKASNKLLK